MNISNVHIRSVKSKKMLSGGKSYIATSYTYERTFLEELLDYAEFVCYIVKTGIRSLVD